MADNQTTAFLVPVALPDGVKIKSVIGEKDGALYELQITGPIYPQSWPLHAQHPSNRRGANQDGP